MLFAVVAVVACKVSTNLDQVIALDITVPYGGQVEFKDTIVPGARALNGHGDSVQADFKWVSLSTNLVVLDSATGATLGDATGTGTLQAQVGPLRSNPVTVTVIPRVDSAQAIPPDRDTVIVSQPDSLSDTLSVQLFASPSAAVNRKVVFTATTYPASGPTVTFVPRDTVSSNSSGVALVQLKFLGGTVPDSVIVTASVRRPDGTPIPGPNASFVVEFRP